MSKGNLTFNGPLETGLRLLSILVSAYPNKYDNNQLLMLDFMVIHTEDFNGPKSLHPKNIYRSSEFLVRKKIMQQGLDLMMSRGFIHQCIDKPGIYYQAGDAAELFLNILSSSYIKKLRHCSEWVVAHYKDLNTDEINKLTNSISDQWINEFHSNKSFQENIV